MCPPVHVPGWTVTPGIAAGGKRRMTTTDQGTTGTDRDIGSFGGPQPAGPGADRDRSVVKST